MPSTLVMFFTSETFPSQFFVEEYSYNPLLYTPSDSSQGFGVKEKHSDMKILARVIVYF